MKCLCIRTAMCGGGLSYDIYVKKKGLPSHVLLYGFTTIIMEGGEYFRFEDATAPKEAVEMEPGMGRYCALQAHNKFARQTMLRIAQRAFPELMRFGDHLPPLWVHNLLKKETSQMVEVDFK